MNRNTQSHFSQVPRADIARSRFDRSSSIKTSFNVGELVPFYVDEVLPGDTFSVDTSKVVRMQTMITPIMDNVYLDTYWFYVPSRILWEHWRELMGENRESAWIPKTEYSVPQVTAPSGGWEVGTIADYMGIPTGISNLSINALPFRAYAEIVNEWFRDQNLQDPVNIPYGDATVAGSNGDDYLVDLVKGGKPFIAAKYHDYFTSCLPGPQKGPDVELPLGNLPDLPVVTGDAHFTRPQDHPSLSFAADSEYNGGAHALFAYQYGSSPVELWGATAAAAESYMGLIRPNNLWAIGSGESLNSATVNQLRLAFAIQKFYERDARSGTRYVEILKAHFGVTAPDARLQRPEYLGGNRVPININQVVQQSATVSGGTPQGTPVGLPQTADSNSDFTKSFVEHGFLIGLMVARYDHTYQQGLDRMWSRKTRFDYYFPVFANIGEQPVLNKEIYAQGNAQDDEVFGYQEAWADYRYRPSRVTGQMRSQYDQSLDVWHLADDYNLLPSLSPSWIQEDYRTVDRVLAVSSELANQLFADVFIRLTCVRPMPVFSVPGLIDHH